MTHERDNFVDKHRRRPKYPGIIGFSNLLEHVAVASRQVTRWILVKEFCMSSP